MEREVGPEGGFEKSGGQRREEDEEDRSIKSRERKEGRERESTNA